MKQNGIKAWLGKLAATGTALLFLVLIPAMASGALPLWAVLLLGGAGVVILNGACGILLGAQDLQEPVVQPRRQAAPRPVPLRVLRGGRAA